MTTWIQFAAIVLAALSMAVHFGTWLTERPIRRTRSGTLFTEVQQGRDAVAAGVMPILGNAAILLIAFSLFLVSADTNRLLVGITALALYIADMVVTLRFNVPLNKEVQSWQPDAPPAEWARVRDRWERFHTLRTMLVVPGFILYVASVILF